MDNYEVRKEMYENCPPPEPINELEERVTRLENKTVDNMHDHVDRAAHALDIYGDVKHLIEEHMTLELKRLYALKKRLGVYL